MTSRPADPRATGIPVVPSVTVLPHPHDEDYA